MKNWILAFFFTLTLEALLAFGGWLVYRFGPLVLFVGLGVFVTCTVTAFNHSLLEP